MNTQLTNLIDWVGFVDWNVREFHGYQTERGSSYNAYLIRADKPTLVDTVKAAYADRLLEHVKRHLSLDQIVYLVCNHAEPDHSGSLPAVVKACPNAEVVCNAKCRDALEHYYDTTAWKWHVIQDAETLSLGNRTLQFFDTPMVHWPESMATYVQEDAVLFSMDAFGQHYATAERFDDEADLEEVLKQAKTYYANIVLLYGRPVATTLKRLGGLKLKIVAPSHGVIWRSHFDRILAAYQDWMVAKPTRKVMVIYSTMWHSTERMAEAVAAGAAEFPVDVRLVDVRVTSDTSIVTDCMDCAAIAVGSATLNMGIMPRMAATLTYLRGLRPVQGKASFAFGSYGWGPKGLDEVVTYLKAMQTVPVCEPVSSRFAPDAATLEKCRAAGRELAKAALK